MATPHSEATNYCALHTYPHFLDEERELLKCAVVVSSRCRVPMQCLLKILNQWDHLQRYVRSGGISDGASGARGRQCSRVWVKGKPWQEPWA